MAPPVEFLCLFRDVGLDEHGVSFGVEVFLPADDVWAIGVRHASVQAGLAVALCAVRVGERTLPLQRAPLLVYIWQVRLE